MKSTEAQLKARRNYGERNKHKARMPGCYLNDDTAKKLDDLAAVMGIKMAAIMAAIELLHGEQFKDKEN